jgi:hypothetical protein
MFADTRPRLLQALRLIVDTANAEPHPAAASSVILRWLDRELRDIEIIVVPRKYKATQIIDLLGDELARAVARGLADDDQVASTRLAITKIIDDIEADLDADIEYRLVS